MSHTIESGVTDIEATPVSARLCVDPAAPGAKTTIAATPTSVNPARKSWMMRTGSPLAELLGRLTLDLHGCRRSTQSVAYPLDLIMHRSRPVAQEIRASQSCSAASRLPRHMFQKIKAVISNGPWRLRSVPISTPMGVRSIVGEGES